MGKYIVLYAIIVLQAIFIAICIRFIIKFKGIYTNINDMLHDVSQGDLTKRIDSSGNGFLNMIHTNLDNLILKLRDLVAQIITLTDKTVNYTSELNNDTMIINTSAKETVKVVNEIAKSMENQMYSIREAEEYSMDAMNSSRHVVNQSEEVSQKINSTIKTVESSYENFQTLIEKLDVVAKDSTETANKIRQLESQNTLIQSIADKVSDISDSTNLLALNAAIEAARAGEAGRGFAVVAAEVGKLAEDSTVQSKHIQEVVDDIKEEIHIISRNMEKEIESIREYINFSQVTREYLEEITKETKDLYNVFKEIGSEIDGQEEKINKVVDIIKGTSHTFENIAASTEEMVASAEEQANTTEETFQRISNLLDMNKDIESYIAGFVQNFKIDAQTQKYIDNSLNELINIAKEPCLIDMEYKSSTKYLVEMQKKNPHFELLASMQKDGLRKSITLDYTEQEVYVNFGHRPYFKEAIAGKNFISKPYISVDTKNYCIAIAVPVKDKHGEIVGVIMGDLTL